MRRRSQSLRRFFLDCTALSSLFPAASQEFTRICLELLSPLLLRRSGRGEQEPDWRASLLSRRYCGRECVLRDTRRIEGETKRPKKVFLTLHPNDLKTSNSGGNRLPRHGVEGKWKQRGWCTWAWRGERPKAKPHPSQRQRRMRHPQNFSRVVNEARCAFLVRASG
jgi:hypothetical protein